MPLDALFTRAFEVISSAQRPLIVCHIKPDGDALASLGLVAEYFASRGIRADLFCATPPPSTYGFLPHLERLMDDRALVPLSNYDCLVVLDCGQLSRTGLTDEIRNRPAGISVIEFDHHPPIDHYADVEVRAPEYSSTCEVLYHFCKAVGIRVTKPMATCILTGILTDTGNLLYESTSETTVSIAAQMLTLGARFPLILEGTARNKSLSGMKLWGRAMSNLILDPRYGVAVTVLTREDIEQSGATDEEFEGIAGFLNNIGEARAIMILREVEPGIIKGSLRTNRPDVDVSLLARALGGGGHRRASAFVLSGKIVKTEGGWKIE